jgi:UDP-N-acetylglucosamine--N-acetylmuramyl-(pentapeptide) pyrophosphoryl-undecaprenol N-acetylglucosamine transferase
MTARRRRSPGGLRCLIAAGGTAGHVLPSLAVAEALRERGVAVTFAGSPDRVEARLVPARGYAFDPFAISGFPRQPSPALLRALVRAGRAPTACVRILRRRRPHVVLGGGGYVAGPAGLAAVTRGIPLVLTEADSHLGLTNRLLAPRARRVCLAFPIPGREGDPYLVTGRPVPRAVVEADRGAARRRFGIGAEEQCLTVVGGSLGARSINDAALEAFGRDESGPWVLHVAGRRDHPVLRARLDSAGAPSRYVLLDYEPSLGDVLAAADLVISRAGGSVMEIAAAGRPAILVPYPHATADHQTTNAHWMAEGGAATVIPDAELDAARLHSECGELLADRARLSAMADASARLARPDAAARIAEEVLTAARGEAA